MPPRRGLLQDTQSNISRVGTGFDTIGLQSSRPDAFLLPYSRGGGTDDLPRHLLNDLSYERGTLAQVSFGA